jgi:hypothetical protein
MTAEVPLDEEEFRRWRDEAQVALESGRHQAAGGFHNWACFASGPAATRYGTSDSRQALADAELILSMVDTGWAAFGA